MNEPHTQSSPHDWATRHFENWREWTSEIAGKPGTRVLEIGSFEGRSAVWWLENVCTHETSRLWCVDPWDWKEFPHAEAVFEERILPHAERVTVLREESIIALGRIYGGLKGGVLPSFDLVYVDGSHEGRDVCLDVLMSVPLLKVGGILVCDDWDWHADGLVMQPRAGIQRAFELNVDRLSVFHCEYQLAARRIA